MKKVLLSLAVMAFGVCTMAQTEIFSVNISADAEKDAAITTSSLVVSGGSFISSDEKTSCSGKIDDVAIMGIKLSTSANRTTFQLNNKLHVGDIITVKGYISSGDATKAAYAKFYVGNDENIVLKPSSDVVSFFDNKITGDQATGYVREYSITITAEGLSDGDILDESGIIKLARQGGTNAFIESISITSTIDLDPITVTPVTDIEANGEVVSVEYYNVAGAQIEKPAKGVNIVKTTYSNGATVTSKIVK